MLSNHPTTQSDRRGLLKKSLVIIIGGGSRAAFGQREF
jgi:hypothetical protein